MTGYSIAFWWAEIRGWARCQLHFSVMAYQFQASITSGHKWLQSTVLFTYS